VLSAMTIWCTVLPSLVCVVLCFSRTMKRVLMILSPGRSVFSFFHGLHAGGEKRAGERRERAESALGTGHAHTHRSGQAAGSLGAATLGLRLAGQTGRGPRSCRAAGAFRLTCPRWCPSKPWQRCTSGTPSRADCSPAGCWPAGECALGSPSPWTRSTPIVRKKKNMEFVGCGILGWLR
jgi:hypothetical protein